MLHETICTGISKKEKKEKKEQVLITQKTRCLRSKTEKVTNMQVKGCQKFPWIQNHRHKISSDARKWDSKYKLHTIAEQNQFWGTPELVFLIYHSVYASLSKTRKTQNNTKKTNKQTNLLWKHVELVEWERAPTNQENDEPNYLGGPKSTHFMSQSQKEYHILLKTKKRKETNLIFSSEALGIFQWTPFDMKPVCTIKTVAFGGCKTMNQRRRRTW